MITHTKASRKACKEAHANIGHSHFWGDKGNAGVNFKRGKNKKAFQDAVEAQENKSK